MRRLPRDDLRAALPGAAQLQVARLTCELRRQGADYRYIPLLVTAPGFGWINASVFAGTVDARLTHGETLEAAAAVGVAAAAQSLWARGGERAG